MLRQTLKYNLEGVCMLSIFNRSEKLITSALDRVVDGIEVGINPVVTLFTRTQKILKEYRSLSPIRKLLYRQGLYTRRTLIKIVRRKTTAEELFNNFILGYREFIKNADPNISEQYIISKFSAIQNIYLINASIRLLRAIKDIPLSNI